MKYFDDTFSFFSISEPNGFLWQLSHNSCRNCSEMPIAEHIKMRRGCAGERTKKLSLASIVSGLLRLAYGNEAHHCWNTKEEIPRSRLYEPRGWDRCIPPDSV
ncbi:hypothetical protein AVEN_257374-1 [Araneus ventricosus]|uniref:Uncharacterized protein n=1 Tax=Araneus ventricosus TaxID=182803 RepID=A0A4Y2CAW7_ARAVE|nr:hypothetical protein AVEN_257374-1 [Araneus ventricosus]